MTLIGKFKQSVFATSLICLYSISKDCNAYLTVESWNFEILPQSLMDLVKKWPFSFNIQNSKNDTSLFSLRKIKILPNMQKKKLTLLIFFLQAALIIGVF